MIDTKLVSLLKVYETGNYTRAAKQLSLTQPAVSQHIRALDAVPQSLRKQPEFGIARQAARRQHAGRW